MLNSKLTFAYTYIYIHDLIYNQFFVYDMKTWFQILNVAFKETWE